MNARTLQMNTFISPKNGRETDRKTDRKKQSTSANYRLTTTHNAQMTIRTEAKPPKKTKRLKKNNSYVENMQYKNMQNKSTYTYTMYTMEI